MRRASLLLAVTGTAVPFTWAYLATAALYREADARGAYLCGLPALANSLLAAFVRVIACAAALLLGSLAYRRLPTPRPRRRLAELAALALPALVVVGYLASFFLGGS